MENIMDLNKISELSQQVMKICYEIMNEKQTGDRIRLPELAEIVAAKTNSTAKQVMPLINFFAQNADEMKVELGRNGGLYKGGSIKKPTSGKIKRISGSPITDSINGVIKISD